MYRDIFQTRLMLTVIQQTWIIESMLDKSATQTCTLTTSEHAEIKQTIRPDTNNWVERATNYDRLVTMQMSEEDKVWQNVLMSHGTDINKSDYYSQLRTELLCLFHHHVNTSTYMDSARTRGCSFAKCQVISKGNNNTNNKPLQQTKFPSAIQY